MRLRVPRPRHAEIYLLDRVGGRDLVQRVGVRQTSDDMQTVTPRYQAQPAIHGFCRGPQLLQLAKAIRLPCRDCGNPRAGNK
jgi:hypothetical protein